MDLKEIKEIMDILKGTDINEIEIERDGVKIKLKRSIEAGQPRSPSKPNRKAAETEPKTLEKLKVNKKKGDKEVVSEKSNLVPIKSPIVGTFFRTPAPDADPYVKEGDYVKKGHVLCIIEAMKLMNEIEAELDGKVVSILAENAQFVEYGETLFLIEPSK